MRALPVLLALVLAGCLSAPPPAAPAPAGLAFQDLQRLPGDRIGAEPNIAMDGKGNVWVIAVGSVLAAPGENVAQGAVNLWHSPDEGKTWARQRDPGPQDKNGTFCSCDTDVDVGPDGTLYITDFWVTPSFNGFVTEASHDLGQTWDPGNPVTVLTPAGNDRQYIAAGTQPGEVYLAYAAGGPGAVAGALPVGLPLPAGTVPVGGLALWRSADSGRTFTPQSQVAPGDFIARHHVGPDGTVFFGYTLLAPGARDGWNDSASVFLAASHDQGVTWKTVKVGDVPDGVGGLWPMEFDVGPDGMVHVVWMERVPAGGSRLYYARSTDGAASFSAPRLVGWSNGTALLPWLSHAGPGRAVIAYYGTPQAVVPLDAPASTRWQAWALSVDANGSTPPVPVAPWAVKVGTFCPRGAACPEDRELLDYPAIAWRDGWAVVAFAQSLSDPGTGPRAAHGPGQDHAEEPRGGHSTNAYVWVGRAALT